MDEKDKTELRQELRDLIVRKFQMRHHLSMSEIKQLLKEIPALSEPDPLSGKPLLTKNCPDCNTEMSHSSDYSHHLIDIFTCPKCGCRIEVIHGRRT